MNDKPKRIITPHKGGRNAAFPHSRLTKEERAMLYDVLAHRGMSAADWVSEKIINEHREIFGSAAALDELALVEKAIRKAAETLRRDLDR